MIRSAASLHSQVSYETISELKDMTKDLLSHPITMSLLRRESDIRKGISTRTSQSSESVCSATLPIGNQRSLHGWLMGNIDSEDLPKDLSLAGDVG